MSQRVTTQSGPVYIFDFALGSFALNGGRQQDLAVVKSLDVDALGDVPWPDLWDELELIVQPSTTHRRRPPYDEGSELFSRTSTPS